MKKLLSLIVVSFCLSCTMNPGNGSEIGNSRTISGKIVTSDGKPAADVEVKLFASNYAPGIILAKSSSEKMSSRNVVIYTNSDGVYTIPLPDTGSYNVLGESSDYKYVFIQDILVTDSQDVTLPADTLRAPGKIQGISHMPFLDSVNQIRVTMYMPGTDLITKPNVGGEFQFSNVPAGEYRLIFDPTISDYYVKILKVKVESGKTLDLDTVILYGDKLTGVPKVNAGNDTLLSIEDTLELHGKADDPLGGIVKLEWDIGYTGNFLLCPSGDTVIQLPRVDSDTILRCILRAMDTDSIYSFDTINVRVLNSVPVVKIEKDTTVSIGDEVQLSWEATDTIGRIMKVEIDIGNTGNFNDVVRADTVIRVPDQSDSGYKCIVRATDEDGTVGVDTCRVHVLQDVPLVHHINDITACINSTYEILVTASDTYGSLDKCVFDIGGDGIFEDTLMLAGNNINGRKVYTAPDTACVIEVVVAVKDDDNNWAKDTVFIYVQQCEPEVNAGTDTYLRAGLNQVTLHGTANDNGSITKWEWNINNEGFVETSTGDTSFQLSSYGVFNCILRVTDNDNNIAADTVQISHPDSVFLIADFEDEFGRNSLGGYPYVFCTSFEDVINVTEDNVLLPIVHGIGYENSKAGKIEFVNDTIKRLFPYVGFGISLVKDNLGYFDLTNVSKIVFWAKASIPLEVKFQIPEQEEFHTYHYESSFQIGTDWTRCEVNLKDTTQFKLPFYADYYPFDFQKAQKFHFMTMEHIPDPGWMVIDNISIVGE